MAFNRGRSLDKGLLALTTLATLAIALGGCGPKASDGDGGAGDVWAADDRFDRRAMLVDQAGEVIRPNVAAFATDASALHLAVKAWRSGGADKAERTTAQNAWKTAFLRWQTLEVFQVGPAAMDSAALRTRIYSYPLLSPCAVDQATADCDATAGCDDAGLRAACARRRGDDDHRAIRGRPG